MKIHLISDTHNEHLNMTMPGGDILIHSGDATNRGTLTSILEFFEWYAKQPYKYKIFVPGNHDWGFEHNEPLFREEAERRGIVLLINQSVEIEGIKIWGSPYSPRFFDWAFNADRGHVIRAIWDLIPDDTELLITHGPPEKILDYVPGTRGGSVGCRDLWHRILHLEKLKMHVFGHIHYSRGTKLFHGVQFVNASSVNDRHQVLQGVPWKVVRDAAGNYEVEE